MRAVWSLVVLAALTACGANQETEDVAPITQTGPVTIVAQNRRTDDVVVTLVRDGLRQRLGLVTAQSDGNFQIPWSQVSNSGRVRLVATPIAGRRSFVSEQLILRPGSEVTVSLTPLLNQSLVRVY
jgi:hypothetical protein